MTCKARLSLVGVVVGVVLAGSGCGGSTTTSDSPSTSSGSATSSAPAELSSAPAGTKVSANTASESEIESALNAAAVSNAARWAEEVVEYRPYPADDMDLTKLRENLAKYNPGQETVDKIVSALTP